MDFEDIIYEATGGIARITINRPERHNAFRSRTLDELTEAFEMADEDCTIGVVILTGAGDRAFCAGGDISEMGELDPMVGRKFLGKCLKLSNTMRALSKPIIAAVNGYCLGGGHEINAMCDLTIAGDEAVFGQTGPSVGSAPVWGGTQLLPRLIGEKKAREMAFLCYRYSARDAEKMGLVNKVVPSRDVMEAAEEWANRILEMSPQSIKLTRTSMNFATDMLYPSFMHGREMLALVYGSEELTEGMKCFEEKRKPDFQKFRR
ncbi:MAG: 1,4-dihydroxy-6-naphthoate synthase [Actinobacteria bacterium]|jgi:dihydroxynaphthoic acid synthetase|nr:MAG: 1,4-dihydroxy-6-naphthoate synthase [Actinomycetota bacterium]